MNRFRRFHSILIYVSGFVRNLFDSNGSGCNWCQMRSEELLVKQENRHANKMHDGRSKNLAYVCDIKESR